jgi:hypothetical protein
MFDKERIAKMKKGVLIVNNARGAIMDTQAVVDACSSGQIGGNKTTIQIYLAGRYETWSSHEDTKASVKITRTINLLCS